MSRISSLVRELEEENDFLKSNAGIEKDVIGRNLYSYSFDDEEGYVLSRSLTEAKEQVKEGAKIVLIMDSGALMELIKNKTVTTYLLPY